MRARWLIHNFLGHWSRPPKQTIVAWDIQVFYSSTRFVLTFMRYRFKNNLIRKSYVSKLNFQACRTQWHEFLLPFWIDFVHHYMSTTQRNIWNTTVASRPGFASFVYVVTPANPLFRRLTSWHPQLSSCGMGDKCSGNALYGNKHLMLQRCCGFCLPSGAMYRAYDVWLLPIKWWFWLSTEVVSWRQ